MTDEPDHLKEIAERVRAQVAELESQMSRVDAIEAEAESMDRMVRVRVNASGMVLGIQLHQATARMDRGRLGTLIAETAQAAAHRASDAAHQFFEGLLATRVELQQAAEAINPQAREMFTRQPSAPRSRAPGLGMPTEPPPVQPAQQRPQQRPSLDDEDAHYERFNQNPFRRS
ncbi:YbaB/EbfC family nucleoid-associated protein [Mycobacteroides chelonae]|jgi:DNA-binding protein YbaB